jgi:hypothetical protein
MSTSRRVLLASLAAVSGAFGFAATAEASQGFGSFFWSGPYDGAARTQPYHGASPERYYVPSHKKKAARSEGRRSTKSSKHRAALAVPNETRGALRPITCERAQAIVADYGFEDVKAELCTERNFEFRAMRDGKAFSIKVEDNGELTKVQRLR